MTSPRRATNQRLAIIAPKTSAIDPVPSPTSTPQQATSCQLRVISVVSAEPAAMTTSAQITTRRMPKRSISAAANGAISP